MNCILLYIHDCVGVTWSKFIDTLSDFNLDANFMTILLMNMYIILMCMLLNILCIIYVYLCLNSMLFSNLYFRKSIFSGSI